MSLNGKRNHSENIDSEPKKKREKICPHCSASFSRNGHLSEHVTSIHTKEFAYSCKECGVGFNRNSLLQKHKENHHISAKFAASKLLDISTKKNI